MHNVLFREFCPQVLSKGVLTQSAKCTEKGSFKPNCDGEGMDLESVTDMAGAGDGARSGVGGLGPGQVGVRVAGAGVGLSEVHGVLA